MTPSPRAADFFRSLPGRASVVLVVIAAAGAVFLIRHGSLSVGSTVAFGESIHHAVAPLFAGRVRAIRVHVGQHVKAGDVIAEMDGETLRLARERAQAQLQKLEADVVAAAHTEEFEVTRGELWVLRARASERGDRAALKEISARMQRLDGLLAKQMVSASEAEAVRQKRTTLAARVEAYDAARSRGQAGLHADETAELAHAKAVEVKVEPMRQAVHVQEAQLHELDHQIAELTLRAPVDGVVTTLPHSVGDVVQAGSEIVGLMSTRKGLLVAVVPAHQAIGISEGVAAEVHRDYFGAPTLHGRVVEVAPEVDEAPLRVRLSPSIPAWGRRVSIQLDGDAAILPGEAFRVSFP